MKFLELESSRTAYRADFAVYALAVLFMFVIFDFALWTFGVAVAMFGYLAFNFWQ